MPPPFPLGLAPLTFTPTLPAPAQALLASGRVLAYGVGFSLPGIDEEAYPSHVDGVAVCLPTPDGPRWVWKWEDVAQHGDGAVALAMLSLTQHAFSPDAIAALWEGMRSPHAPDLHTTTAEVDLVITPQGAWLELQYSHGSDIYAATKQAQQALDTPGTDGADALARVPFGGLVCLLAPGVHSAHEAVSQAAQMQALFDQVFALATNDSPSDRLLTAARPFLRAPSGEEIQALRP